MPPSTVHLNTIVVVRRVGIGAVPFTWEIRESGTVVPSCVSPDRFRSMEAAYSAGQARLAESLRPKPVQRKKVSAIQAPAPKITDYHDWHSDKDDSDGTDLDINPTVCDVPALSHESQTSSCLPNSVQLEYTVS
jgi:hypothetical protein